MSQRFNGLHGVVTGGIRGIGGAVTEQLRTEGATVAVADLLDGSCDVTDRTQLERFFSGLPRLDILVCVAGRPWSLTAESATDTDWRKCFELNLEAVWHAVQAALPLLKQSAAASIVTIPSYHALRPGKASFPYSVAKGGLISLTRSLAVELAPRIRVNGVIPGQIESVRTADYFAQFRDPEEARRRTVASFPMQRLGTPEDIAKAVAFLASSDANWITGTCLMVDGGRDAAGLDLTDLR